MSKPYITVPIEIPIGEFLAAWGLSGHMLIVIRRQA